MSGGFAAKRKRKQQVGVERCADPLRSYRETASARGHFFTEFQAWRIVGALFLAVYAFGHLPGLFAWPAGLGDIAVGLAAPVAAWKLRQNPGFLTSVRYRLFHYFGLTDFAVAVVIGAAARNQITGLVDQVTTAPMGVLPLVLIPTLIVPAFIILHLIVLMQIAVNRR